MMEIGIDTGVFPGSGKCIEKVHSTSIVPLFSSVLLNNFDLCEYQVGAAPLSPVIVGQCSDRVIVVPGSSNWYKSGEKVSQH